MARWFDAMGRPDAAEQLSVGERRPRLGHARVQATARCVDSSPNRRRPSSIAKSARSRGGSRGSTRRHEALATPRPFARVLAPAEDDLPELRGRELCQCGREARIEGRRALEQPLGGGVVLARPRVVLEAQLVGAPRLEVIGTALVRALALRPREVARDRGRDGGADVLRAGTSVTSRRGLADPCRQARQEPR
jgi:hypothetical protein